MLPDNSHLYGQHEKDLPIWKIKIIYNIASKISYLVNNILLKSSNLMYIHRDTFWTFSHKLRQMNFHLLSIYLPLYNNNNP